MTDRNTDNWSTVPLRRVCAHCDEEGATESMPFIGANARLAPDCLWFHDECQLRNVLGGLKHQRKLCRCYNTDGDSDPPEGMTKHQEAEEIMKLVRADQWSYG